MQLSTLLVPVFAVLASAQSTTVVSYFEAFVNNSPYSISISKYHSVGASIAGINAEHTTYEVDCMSDAPQSECSFAAPYTMVAGPTTLSYSRPIPFQFGSATYTVQNDLQCSFTHKTESATCTGSVSISYGGQSTSTVATHSIPTSDIWYQPLTITAGLEKLNSPQATQAPGAAPAPRQPMVTAAPLGAAAALAAAALF